MCNRVKFLLLLLITILLNSSCIPPLCEKDRDCSSAMYCSEQGECRENCQTGKDCQFEETCTGGKCLRKKPKLEKTTPQQPNECKNGETLYCYNGNSQKRGIGICQAGMRSCVDGRWTVCIGEVLPQKEVCDGKDNNCNGKTDEGLTNCMCQIDSDCSVITPSCQKGICVRLCEENNHCKDDFTCVKGLCVVCNAGGSRSNREVCNGKDDNCNGKIDEIPPITCGNNTGTCKAGYQECRGGVWSGCIGNISPSKEVCDGLDNDCDGQRDENLQNCKFAPHGTKTFRTLTFHNGHTGYVSKIVFHPSQNSFVTVDGNSLRYWDGDKGKQITTFKAHDRRITDIAFHPQGKKIASMAGNKSKEVRLWEFPSGKLIKKISHGQDDLTCIAFHPNGQHIATAHKTSVNIWELTSGKLLKTLYFQHATSTTISFRPDGMGIAVGSQDGHVSFWELPSGKHQKTINLHQGTIHSIAFSLDSQTFASGGQDRLVRLVKTNTYQHVGTLSGHVGTIQSLAFHSGGKYLASMGDYRDKSVRLWSLTTGKLFRSFQHKEFGYSTLSFSPDKQHLVYGHLKSIVFVNIYSGQKTKTLSPNLHIPLSVAVHPNNQTILVGGQDGDFSLWEANTGKLLKKKRAEKGGPSIRMVSFSSDGSLFATLGKRNEVRLWNTNSGNHFQTLKGNTLRINDIDFHPTKNWLVSASDDRSITIWDYKTGKILQTINEKQRIRNVAFSRDGQRLVYNMGREIKVWNLKQWGKFSVIADPNFFGGLALHPTKNLVATTIGTNLLFFDGNSATKQHTFNIQRYTRQMSFSLDGKLFLFTTVGGNIHILHAENGKEIGVLNSHSSDVTSLDFASSGSFLATSSMDGTIRLWR